jgi:uncharacterized protein (TIGR01777 family)
MDIVITGASGFVGKALSQWLLEAGHTVTGLGTSPNHPFEEQSAFTWMAADTTQPGAWQTVVHAADTVVNLAGRSIAKRWTRSYKQQIMDSRLETTRHVVEALDGENTLLLNASAVGFYGSRGDEVLKEDSAPGGDFLARLAVAWEAAALRAREKGVRIAVMRFGVVLGKGGGALEQMLPAFRRFAGGPLGTGRQWFSWIHMADLLSAAHFLLENEKAKGIYNVTSPEPLRQKEFAKALGSALGRPAVLAAPRLALKLMLGEMAEVLLASQRVRPNRLITEGFSFRFPEIDRALSDLLHPS